MRPLVLLVGLIVAASSSQAQSTRYVTDSLKLEARSGPGVQNRIVRMLESGTKLTILDRAEGWSNIALPDGSQAWILDRFLMDEPPARGQLKAALANLKAARSESERLLSQLAQLQSSTQELTESRDAFAEKARAIAAELADIKRTAASAIAVRDENQKLKDKSQNLSKQLATLEQDFTVLRDARSRDWFIAGAGVLLGGMILGLIIPKIRWKRRRSWGEL